jgi:hypothetical protein
MFSGRAFVSPSGSKSVQFNPVDARNQTRTDLGPKNIERHSILDRTSRVKLPVVQSKQSTIAKLSERQLKQRKRKYENDENECGNLKYMVSYL